MVTYTPSLILSSYSSANKINENFNDIEDALNDRLSLASGGTMGDDIDLNSNRIINAATPTLSHQLANKEYVDTVTSVLAGSATGTEALTILSGARFVPLLADLKALDVDEYDDDVVIMNGRTTQNLGGGIFYFVPGDQTALVAIDPGQIVVVPPDSDTTGASGVWHRTQYNRLTPAMAGCTLDDSGDNYTALQRLMDLSATLKVPCGSDRKGDIVRFASELVIPANFHSDSEKPLNIHFNGSSIACTLNGDNISMKGMTLTGNAKKTVTAITQANPGSVTTSSAHGLTTGERVIFYDVAGMTQVNNKQYTVTVTSTTTFTIGVNTSGYGAYTSGGECVHYKATGATSTGIYKPITNPNIEFIDFSYMTISGFTHSGINVGLATDIDISNINVTHCGANGIVLNSVARVRGDGTVHLKRIAPGQDSTFLAYPISFTRNTVYDIATAPASNKIWLDSVFIEDCPYYFAFDIHGAYDVHVNTIAWYNCCAGVNIEHATGGGDEVTPYNITIGSISGEGVLDVTTNDVGYGLFIDANSGGSEISRNIAIGPMTFRRHGTKRTIDDTSLNDEGGVVGISNCNGVILGPIHSYQGYQSVLWVGADAVGVVCQGIVDYGLVAENSIQSTVHSDDSGSTVFLDNIVVNRAAGKVFETTQPNNIKMSNNVSYSGGVAVGDIAPVGTLTSSSVAVGSAVALTTNTAANVTSISLLPGDWDVTFVAHFTGNVATTVDNTECSVSTTSATMSTTPGAFSGHNVAGSALFNSGISGPSEIVSNVRINITSTTTVYGVVLADFAVNSMSAYGLLTARKVS